MTLMQHVEAASLMIVLFIGAAIVAFAIFRLIRPVKTRPYRNPVSRRDPPVGGDE